MQRNNNPKQASGSMNKSHEKISKIPQDSKTKHITNYVPKSGSGSVSAAMTTWMNT